jgi:hypothetical protein
MHKKILPFLFLFFCQFSFAQTNLVPNWSFENYDTCPDNVFQLNRCSDWLQFRNPCDYFNACCTNGIEGVPDNIAGTNMEAACGVAYVVINAYTETIINYKTYIGAQLTSPLVVGTKYYVNFKASPCGFHSTQSTTCQGVCNKLGAFFTTIGYNYQTNPMPIPNYSQVYTDSLIKDTGVWTTVRGSFIADSAYQYIAIGNFFSDSLTTYMEIYPPGDGPCAAYYIDCICCSSDSMYCETLVTGEETHSKPEISVYPNPCINELTIEMNNVSASIFYATIYDIEGRTVLNEKFPIQNDASIDLHSLNSGLYLLSLKMNNESKKIVFIKN